MDRLKAIIEQHSRWQPLVDYIHRIEGYADNDFPLCIENAKSLLESIAKEICDQKNQAYAKEDSTGKILKLAFLSLGYGNNATIHRIGTSISDIGHQMSTLRNEIGATSHGKTLNELEKRNDDINKTSSDFLLSSTELVCCFLIQSFETDNPRKAEKESTIEFEDNSEFNDFLDDLYGDFTMKDYSFAASEILFSDTKAYATELTAYNGSLNETDN